MSKCKQCKFCKEFKRIPLGLSQTAKEYLDPEYRCYVDPPPDSGEYVQSKETSGDRLACRFFEFTVGYQAKNPHKDGKQKGEKNA
jgi:hypothetical protein